MSPIRVLYVAAVLLEVAGVLLAQPPVAPPVTEAGPPVAPPIVLTTSSSGDEAAPGFVVAVKREEVGGYAHGGGTVVAAEDGKSLVLTNAHVARDATRPLTVTTGGYEYKARYVAGSPVYDLGPGYIKIDGPDLAVLEVGYELPTAVVSLDAPAKGSRVRQWGYAGRPYTAAPAYKTGVTVGEGGNDLLTTLPCDHGDSGSGLVNDDGELVAVCHGKPPANVFAGEVKQYAVRTGVVTVYLEERTPRLFGRLRARIAERRLMRELAKAPVRVVPPAEAPKAEPKAPPAAPKVVPPLAYQGPVTYSYYEYDPRTRTYRQVYSTQPPCVNGQCPRR